jgi:hypothetical protein
MTRRSSSSAVFSSSSTSPVPPIARRSLMTEAVPLLCHRLPPRLTPPPFLLRAVRSHITLSIARRGGVVALSITQKTFRRGIDG